MLASGSWISPHDSLTSIKMGYIFYLFHLNVCCPHSAISSPRNLKIEPGTNPEEDTMYNVCSPGTVDKHSSEIESSTDEDIGSILEEMSKLADTLNAASEPECIILEYSSKNPAQEEKSLEELLEEADQLVRRNICGISDKIFKSDELDADCNIFANKNVKQFCTNIFQRIEEVHGESEKNKNTTERAKNKRLQKHTEQLPIKYNLDYLLEKDSTSKRLQKRDKAILQKNNLQQELTDIDKNFFDDVLSKSAGVAEDVKLNDFNLEEEKCSLFPKSLQMSFKDDEQNSLNYILKHSGEKSMFFNGNLEESNFETYILSRMEITENLEKALFDPENLTTVNALVDSKNNNDRHELARLKGENNIAHKAFCKKLAENSNQINLTQKLDATSDMYTVSLTPRLELFADDISKLRTKKSNENSETQKQEVSDKKISFQSNIKKTSQKNNIKEMTHTSMTKPKEVANFPISSLKNEECFGFIQEGSVTSESWNPISESATNRGFITKSHKSPKKVYQCKKLFPKIKVLSKSNSNLINKVKLPLKPRKDSLKSNAISKLILTAKIFSDWKSPCYKEEEKNYLMKKELDLKEKFYKTQIKNVRSSFDQELFSIKKQNIVLKDKIDDLFIKKESPELLLNHNSQLRYLEKELEEYKRLADSYEAEKNKFIKNIKCLQEEVKNLEQKIVPTEMNELQRQIDHIKELQKEIYKLNLELSELRQQNLDNLLKNDDIHEQNILLKDELNIFKEQLEEKNTFIAERLQALTTTELQLRKQIEYLKVDLNTKTEALKVTQLNYEKLEETVLSLEKELLELRVKEGNLQETLGVAKHHAEREKQLSHKLKNQVILDTNKIMDLTRQVCEMERIIKRKNPDSVSALLLTANLEQGRLNSEKIKLLEIRNTTLENEMKVKEEAAQQRLAEFRREFAEMRKKYIIQIVELEDKFLSASVKEKKIQIDMGTQTICAKDKKKKVETWEGHEKSPNVKNNDKREPSKLTKVDSLKLQNKKNDVDSTIYKLNLELLNKNKMLSNLSKEFQELQKTNRRLQKEREKQLNHMRSVFKNVDSNKKNNPGLMTLEKGTVGSKSSDINYDNSNAFPIQCESRLSLQNVSAPTPKLYDPLQYSENSGNSMMKNLMAENSILKEELSKMRKDFMALKNKRLCDLNLLQEEHERELTALIQKYSSKEEELNALKLGI